MRTSPTEYPDHKIVTLSRYPRMQKAGRYCATSDPDVVGLPAYSGCQVLRRARFVAVSEGLENEGRQAAVSDD